MASTSWQSVAKFINIMSSNSNRFLMKLAKVVYTTAGLKAFHCTNFTLGPDIILTTKIHKKFGLHNAITVTKQRKSALS